MAIFRPNLIVVMSDSGGQRCPGSPENNATQSPGGWGTIALMTSSNRFTAKPAAAGQGAGVQWTLAAILLFSACYLALYSHAKAFWGDESLTYFTVHHRSLLGLLRFQSSTPIVLEPPANDILLWAVVHVLGYAKWAFRLPSILLFLCLQCLMFRLATLVGGLRSGLIAAALLITTQFVTYGAEARPYALLTMLTVASLLLWHAAHRSETARGIILVALTLTLAVAITSQFYGGFIFLPVVAAELAWCFYERRRPDLGVVLALAVGLLAILLDIPFIHAVKPYTPPNVDRSLVGFSQFASTYEWGFLQEPVFLKRAHLGDAAFVVLLILIGALGSFPRRRDPLPGITALPLRKALWAALLTLTLYPVPALLIAYFVTHVYSPRYAVQCVLGVVALLSMLLGRFSYRLRRQWLAVAAAVLVLYVLRQCRTHLNDQKKVTQRITVDYPISAPVVAWLNAHPASPVFLTIDECLLYPFYGDPAYNARIRCLGSEPLEAKYNGSIMSSLTEKVMTQHTDMPYGEGTYGDLQKAGPIALVYAPRPWLTWIPSALAAENAAIHPLGNGLGGTVYLVSIPGR